MTEPATPRAGQEAARLLGAAQDWLRTSAPHLAPTDEAGETCSCPLCRAVAGLRDADPDSVARWVDTAVAAATALATQAADLLASTPPGAEPQAAAGNVDDPDAGRGHPEAGRRDDDDPADSDAQPAEASYDGAGPAVSPPDGGAAGQDGSRRRQVRRIPVARDPDGAAT